MFVRLEVGADSITHRWDIFQFMLINKWIPGGTDFL